MSAPRITICVLTEYERAALLSTRAAEIADGQPITIKNPGTTNPAKIAQLEFDAGKCPKKLRRRWPDGRVEIWPLTELKVVKR